jgi:hypothetical protein
MTRKASKKRKNTVAPPVSEPCVDAASPAEALADDASAEDASVDEAVGDAFADEGPAASDDEAAASFSVLLPADVSRRLRRTRSG